MEYGTTVSYEQVVENESEFPAITFCNLNAFDPATNRYVGDYINKRFFENNIQPNIQVNESVETAYGKLKLLESLLKAIVMTEADFTAFNLTLQDVGFTLDTMLISCFYNGLECSKSDFTYYYTFEYGNCYTFNKNGSRTTKISGAGTGLQLELFVGVPGIRMIFKS